MGLFCHSPRFTASPYFPALGRQFQNQRHGKLRHRLGRVTGHVADFDAASRRFLAVDDVGAGGGDGDEFQVARFARIQQWLCR